MAGPATLVARAPPAPQARPPPRWVPHVQGVGRPSHGWGKALVEEEPRAPDRRSPSPRRRRGLALSAQPESTPEVAAPPASPPARVVRHGCRMAQRHHHHRGGCPDGDGDFLTSGAGGCSSDGSGGLDGCCRHGSDNGGDGHRYHGGDDEQCGGSVGRAGEEVEGRNQVILLQAFSYLSFFFSFRSCSSILAPAIVGVLLLALFALSAESRC